jgi:ASC-1-like (ASCH) protein
MLNKDLSKAKLWKWVLCVLIIPFIYFMIKENGIVKQINSLDERINEFNKQHKEIFRDYKVNKLGVAYVPIADQIKYGNKSFIVDHTGMVEESEVKLQLSKQNDLLIETISELEKLSGEAPIVESSTEIEEIETEQYSKSMQQLNQHDYFGKLERSLRTISYCMDDLDVTSVQLPLVANESSYLNFLKEFATNEVPENAPVFKAFDTQKYNEQISKFQELNKLKDSLSRHTAQFEDVLKGLMITMANSVQAISALKIASTDKIVFESNKVLYKILKSPYNHYSPVLEASEIERIRNESFNYSEAVSDYVPFQLKDSSKVRFNLVSGMWTAEDGSTTNFPFGVHQIHEEIVAPMVQNLMNETRIERLKIYNHIKDQKISYLNKWHQDTEDFYGRNRAESADLINLMRASLRDYVAAYNTLSSLKKLRIAWHNLEGL